MVNQGETQNRAAKLIEEHGQSDGLFMAWIEYQAAVMLGPYKNARRWLQEMRECLPPKK